ncbi:MAG TPA: hypothetical protein VI956_10620 [Nitrospirota bacterium]|nr:hypothetical protein [Nitrospirota bacterium]
MKKILFFVLAVLVTAGLTVAGCKKSEEVKPAPKTEHKKGKTAAKKKSSSKKATESQSTKKKSSQKKGAAPESMM